MPERERPEPRAEPVHTLSSMPVDAPSGPLAEHGVVVRLPETTDIPRIAHYAPHSRSEGTWLPVAPLDVDPMIWATWFVRELRLGWTAFGGRFGGGLFADCDGHEVAAFLNVVPLGPGIVELCYGVAPEARGRGVASRCAGIVASWALSAGFQRVELHINADHSESRRVAEKAGFEYAGAVRKTVSATGEDYDDVIYTRSGPNLA